MDTDIDYAIDFIKQEILKKSRFLNTQRLRGCDVKYLNEIKHQIESLFKAGLKLGASFD